MSKHSNGQMGTDPTEILLVEPEDTGLTSFKSEIKQTVDEATVTTATPAGSDQEIQRVAPDGVIYICTPTTTADLTTLSRLREKQGDAPIVVVAKNGSEELATDVLAAGATDYVPYSRVADAPEDLIKRLEQTREEAAMTTAEWQAVFDRLPQPAVEVRYNDDQEPIVQSVNTAFEERFGYTETDICGEILDEWVVPDKYKEEGHALTEAVAAGDAIDAKVVTRQTSDGLRDFLLQTSALNGTNTAFAIYTALSGDREQQQQLEQVQQRYQTYIENTLDIITVLESDGTITYQSPAIEPVLGYTQNELVGESAFEFVHPDDRDQVVEQFQRQISETDSQVGRVEFRFKHADGSWVWLEAISSGQRLPDGYLTVSRDITERKQREQQLRRERDRLDEFASSIAHNFRNPLNVALGALQQAMSRGEREYLETTENALKRMNQLVDELLTLAREGEPIADVTTVQLDEVAQSAWQQVSTNEVELQILTAIRVHADRSRLESVFSLLFDNAIKHGGDVSTVLVGPLSTGEGFYVADDGQGIPKAQRERVFKSGYTTSNQGTGFGLAIIDQIANAHGWDVTVVESSGGGARFEFRSVDILDSPG